MPGQEYKVVSVQAAKSVSDLIQLIVDTVDKVERGQQLEHQQVETLRVAVQALGAAVASQEAKLGGLATEVAKSFDIRVPTRWFPPEPPAEQPGGNGNDGEQQPDTSPAQS